MRKADKLPPSCVAVMKSGNLNFLEPSGPLQACNGTALPLPLFRSYNSIFYTLLFLCLNVIKYSECAQLYFPLTWLRMAETGSTHVKARFESN